MPRSPDEATRFTSTRPHAHSKGPAGTTIDLAGPPPPNETPAQKVNRLREAARRARMGQESTWERIILRGRAVADVAHRTVTTGLILGSIVVTGFAVLSVGGMIGENRRKKKLWFAEQEENYAKAVELARKAEADGTITPGLKMFLNNERALEEAEAEKKAQLGFWTKVRKRAFGELAFEEARSAPRAEIADAGTAQVEITKDTKNTSHDAAPPMTLESVQPTVVHEAQDSRVVESRGGPLDRLGEQAAFSLSSSSQRWLNWVTRW